MSYFNPEIYNYEALKPEHQRLIDFYDIATQDALNRDFIIEDKMGLFSDGMGTVIDKMKREVAEEVFDAIEEYLDIQRLELIVSIMDNDSSYYGQEPEGEAEDEQRG